MSYLNTPYQNKNIRLKNRLVMPPMATAKCPDGKVTPELLAYYDEKSKDGSIGLIITEHSYISMEGKASSNQLSISSDSDIPGLKELVNVIHQNGCQVFAQISHAGMQAKQETTGMIPFSVSNAKNPRRPDDSINKMMTIDEINELRIKFSKAARRAKEAGFDGVEIHSAHGYLLNQFFSPLTNKRKDEYGGSLENRIRFHLEIIRETRRMVGENFPIAIRLGACDYMENGSTKEDAILACIAFENAGADLIDISGGFNGYTIAGCTKQGYFSDITEAIKKAVTIPVILTGGITEPCIAEKLLQENKADLIGVGRAILKDSSWAKKAMDQLESKSIV